MTKPDLQNIGNAGEYFIAAVLSAQGYITTITLGGSAIPAALSIWAATPQAAIVSNAERVGRKNGLSHRR